MSDTDNTIQQRIDDLARELTAIITAPDYRSDMHELLGGEVFHTIFGGLAGDPGGRAYPRNEAEWLTLRRMDRFEDLFVDHCEERLTTDMYADPVQGCGAAVTATIADIVAFRAIELNGDVDTKLTVGTIEEPHVAPAVEQKLPTPVEG